MIDTIKNFFDLLEIERLESDPEKFVQQFGIGLADIDRVMSFLNIHGVEEDLKALDEIRRVILTSDSENREIDSRDDWREKGSALWRKLG